MWDTKYRPMVFSDVLGQEGSIRVLLSRLRKGEAFDTSYIFAGGHGSGKTTLARILARAMFCRALGDDGNPCNACDHCQACLNESMVAFMELDAASQGTTADMRRIVDNLVYSVPGAPKRIYLLDEAHRMSRDAQDVLLKPIEDKRVVIILCTTEVAKIRDTIKSRCETYEIRRIHREDILTRVQKILAAEGVGYEDDAILTVIDHARGHVRDVLNRLETIAQLGPITMDAVRERLDLSVVSQYYEILLALGDAPKAIGLVEQVCDRVGPAQAAVGIAEAAMNAYRQANKIQSDFSQLDRALAEKVHALYGAATPSIAQYFLRAGATSTLDVVCDVVACCAAGGVPVSNVTVVSPPVKVVASAPLVAVAASPIQVGPPTEPAPVQPSKPAFGTRPSQPPPPSIPPSRGVHAEAESVAMPVGGGAPRNRTSLKPVELRPTSPDAMALTQEGFTAMFNEITKSLTPGSGGHHGG